MFVKETLPYLSVLGRFERDSKNISEIDSIYDPPFHSCPHCQSNDIIKFGMSHGRQRYKCKNCNKTFSSSYGSIYYRGRMGCHIIEHMAEELKTNETLYAVAVNNKVNIKTAFRYRHLLLSQLKKTAKMPKLMGKRL